jgi:phosphatidylglycerol:prolipoprotein diacylglycerol transferase
MSPEHLQSLVGSGALISFGEDWGVHWSGLSMSLSIFLSYLLIRWLVYRQKYELSAPLVFDFLIYLSLGSVIGARLGYCLLLDRDIFFQFQDQAPYWGVLSLHHGGFSSFGGFLGGIVACFFFTAKTGISRGYLFDLAAISAPLVVLLTRMAAFFSGEFFGKVAGSQFPYPVKFLNEILYWPTYSLEKIKMLEPIITQLGVDSSQTQTLIDSYGQNESAKAQLHQLLQKVVDQISSLSTSAQAPFFELIEGRYPIQLMEALVQGGFLFVLLLIIWSRPQRPGFIAALFLVLFSISELLLDPLRFHNQVEGGLFFGLTEQTILASLGLLVGLILVLIWNRSEILKTPGWGRISSVRIHRR